MFLINSTPTYFIQSKIYDTKGYQMNVKLTVLSSFLYVTAFAAEPLQCLDRHCSRNAKRPIEQKCLESLLLILIDTLSRNVITYMRRGRPFNQYGGRQFSIGS